MSAQASLCLLARGLVIRERLLLKHPWKPWRCGLWPHIVVTTRRQDPFLGEQIRRIVGSLSHAEEKTKHEWMNRIILRLWNENELMLGEKWLILFSLPSNADEGKGTTYRHINRSNAKI
ncbi:hypothetical protein TNCV_2274481 [Trichonephila clavipes]|nr:hypothetical protein TNCV_2274481 [Trichonephila clavipes]